MRETLHPASAVSFCRSVGSGVGGREGGGAERGEGDCLINISFLSGKLLFV